MLSLSSNQVPDRRFVGAFAAVALMAYVLSITSCGPSGGNGLPPLGANANETSVSGISSGAYMAGQFQLAFGKTVIGAGIIAGGPYGCAESVFADAVIGPAATMLNATKAISGCMLDGMALWGVPNPEALAENAERLAEKGAIDPIASVKTDRVYLFSGTNDHTVMPRIVASAAAFYKALGVLEENIRFVADLPAGHAFVTESAGGACERSGEPYIVDCDYDQARDLLTHIYGTLKAPSSEVLGAYRSFDQGVFARDLDGNAGLGDTGVVYVPAACHEGGCRLHIAFHGCAQSLDTVGDAFVKGAGFQRWADTNRLLVLFPQARASASNPQGCWDWWGYTGRDFLTRQAPQLVAVHRMIEQLAAAP